MPGICYFINNKFIPNLPRIMRQTIHQIPIWHWPRIISRLNIPISTCCLKAPVNLGPSFEMDLEKLECTSYSGLFGSDGQENNPESWKYGVAKYKFNFNNEYPIMCGHCEKSNGVCGYNGPHNSFPCNCPTGYNTTTGYYGQWQSWSSAFRFLPWQIITALACLLGLMLV